MPDGWNFPSKRSMKRNLRHAFVALVLAAGAAAASGQQQRVASRRRRGAASHSRGRAESALRLAAAGGAEGGEPPGRSRVHPLAPDGRRLAPISSALDPGSGELSFTADTGRDPGCATFFYEIIRE